MQSLLIRTRRFVAVCALIPSVYRRPVPSSGIYTFLLLLSQANLLALLFDQTNERHFLTMLQYNRKNKQTSRLTEIQVLHIVL